MSSLSRLPACSIRDQSKVLGSLAMKQMELQLQVLKFLLGAFWILDL
jgi:hypothetical protein